MTLVAFIFLLGYFISWKNEGIGGILMILAGLFVSLPLIIIQGNAGSVMFGIPLTASGLLYILYWFDKRKLNRKSQAKGKGKSISDEIIT